MLKGRPISLTILDFGLFQVHSGPRVIGLMGALIRTDADEVVLIDTGMPVKYIEDSVAAGKEDGLDTFGECIVIGPNNWVISQLQMCGVSSVDLLVISHTHIDHIGGLHAFPGTPILIAEAERALEKPLYWSGAQPMDWPDRDYHLVTEDCEIGPGFEVFLCPGHAPGQLAFRITLPIEGQIIFTSDAISRRSEIEEGFADAWDPEQALFHANRLMQMDHRFMIFGHEPDQWPRLTKAPHAIT